MEIFTTTTTYILFIGIRTLFDQLYQHYILQEVGLTKDLKRKANTLEAWSGRYPGSQASWVRFLIVVLLCHICASVLLFGAFRCLLFVLIRQRGPGLPTLDH